MTGQGWSKWERDGGGECGKWKTRDGWPLKVDIEVVGVSEEDIDDRAKWRRLILIDTAGIMPAEEREISSLCVTLMIFLALKSCSISSKKIIMSSGHLQLLLQKQMSPSLF